ncbi:MAG: hypothetical protein CMG69_02895 [Candidatus Marinimicrobia bacterium]|nr:hypothetical protein [Candidatus Neomarinimicrobiota bacterium]
MKPHLGKTKFKIMLKIENLSKYYYHKPVLKNVTLKIRKGDVVAVMGKNGAGKSTLLKIVSSLVIPNNGTLQLNSEDITPHNYKIRKDLLYMGHEPGFYSAYTCVENLLFCSNLYNLNQPISVINKVLDQAGLKCMKNKPIRFFSQGMLQRLKIAAVNLIPWKLLLFDEPFNGLDGEGKQIFNSMISNWKSLGKTMIFVSHKIDWVLNTCSRVIVLDNSSIVIDKPTSIELESVLENILYKMVPIKVLNKC